MHEGRITDIPSKTLDSVFEELAILECALLKIDCEGAEYSLCEIRNGFLPRER
ncbi:hypothetical protein GOB94_00945 [Granulicella sp. 5B5]|nr:hypothetical protein GOB94_00945 [Granulicella sp. 5B5]